MEVGQWWAAWWKIVWEYVSKFLFALVGNNFNVLVLINPDWIYMESFNVVVPSLILTTRVEQADRLHGAAERPWPRCTLIPSKADQFEEFPVVNSLSCGWFQNVSNMDYHGCIVLISISNMLKSIFIQLNCMVIINWWTTRPSSPKFHGR